jgi:hypothetical protein
MLDRLKINVSRLQQILIENLKKVAFKNIKDFVKTWNLQTSYFILEMKYVEITHLRTSQNPKKWYLRRLGHQV